MRVRHTLVVALVLLSVACAKAPSSLGPTGIKDYHANEAVVAIGEVQHAAIALNGIQLCDPAPCHPLVSDQNTRIVVDAVTGALNTIKVSPDEWKATSNAALDQINLQLDELGRSKLRAYVEAARSIINAL